MNGNTSLTTFRVDLDAVPHDADEVRLRGDFSAMKFYSGVIPPNWTPPPNLRSAGAQRILTVKSKPFDVQIKAPDEPMPMPKVSQEPQLEIVDAKWITDNLRSSGEWWHDTLVLQMRRRDRKVFENPPQIEGKNIQLLDASGRNLELFDSRGKKWKMSFWLRPQGAFSPQRSNLDLFAIFATGQAYPKGGWSRVEAPLRLRAEISHNKSWPQKINVKVERVFMSPQNFGAAK